MCLTCDADRRLEVWRSRQSHGGHGEGVHLCWGLHRRCVLCRWSEVDLIVKVVFKLLHQQKSRVDKNTPAGYCSSAHLSQQNLNSQTQPIPRWSRWSCVRLATCPPGLSPWSWSPSPCSRSHSSLATPPRPQAPSATPPGTGRETQTTCPLCLHLKNDTNRQKLCWIIHIQSCASKLI